MLTTEMLSHLMEKNNFRPEMKSVWILLKNMHEDLVSRNCGVRPSPTALNVVDVMRQTLTSPSHPCSNVPELCSHCHKLLMLTNIKLMFENDVIGKDLMDCPRTKTNWPQDKDQGRDEATETQGEMVDVDPNHQSWREFLITAVGIENLITWLLGQLKSTRFIRHEAVKAILSGFRGHAFHGHEEKLIESILKDLTSDHSLHPTACLDVLKSLVSRKSEPCINRVTIECLKSYFKALCSVCWEQESEWKTCDVKLRLRLVHSETELEIDSVSGLKTDSELGLKINTEIGLKTDPELGLKTLGLKIDSQVNLKTICEVGLKIDAEVSLDKNVKLGTDFEVGLKTDSKVGPKRGFEVELNTDSEIGLKPGSKVGLKTDSESGLKTDSKVEQNTDSEVDTEATLCNSEVKLAFLCVLQKVFKYFNRLEESVKHSELQIILPFVSDNLSNFLFNQTQFSKEAPGTVQNDLSLIQSSSIGTSDLDNNCSDAFTPYASENSSVLKPDTKVTAYSRLLYKKVVDIFNTVLCYGHDLSQKWDVHPVYVSLSVAALSQVCERGLDSVPYTSEFVGFGGTELEIKRLSGDYPQLGDTALLRKLFLLLLKMSAVCMKSAQKDLKPEICIQIVTSVMREINKYVTYHLTLTSGDPDDLSWLPMVFRDQDDSWIEALLCLLDIYLALKRSCYADASLLTTLDPHKLFLQFLDSTTNDHTVLVDLLTSPETCFLLYLVRYLKCVLREWDMFVRVCHSTYCCQDHQNTISSEIFKQKMCTSKPENEIFQKSLIHDGFEKSARMIQGNEKENIVLKHDAQNVLLNPDDQNILLNPDRQNISLNSDEQNILLNPDKQNILLNPDRQNISLNSDEQNILLNPDEQNILLNPDELNISLKPDRQNMLLKPDEQNILLNPERQSILRHDNPDCHGELLKIKTPQDYVMHQSLKRKANETSLIKSMKRKANQTSLDSSEDEFLKNSFAVEQSENPKDTAQTVDSEIKQTDRERLCDDPTVPCLKTNYGKESLSEMCPQMKPLDGLSSLALSYGDSDSCDDDDEETDDYEKHRTTSSKQTYMIDISSSSTSDEALDVDADDGVIQTDECLDVDNDQSVFPVSECEFVDDRNISSFNTEAIVYQSNRLDARIECDTVGQSNSLSSNSKSCEIVKQSNRLDTKTKHESMDCGKNCDSDSKTGQGYACNWCCVDRVLATFIRLRLKITKLHRQDLFPYNPQPLLSVLQQCEDKYELMSRDTQ